MALEYTEEKLNSLDKETLIQLFLSQQEQLKQIDQTLQLVLEQVADLKRHRFGRTSEKHEMEAQISFMEVDGKQEFERYGLHISRQNMANWTIQCADRYLAVLYDYLHEKLYGYHVLQADELCEALHNSSYEKYYVM